MGRYEEQKKRLEKIIERKKKGIKRVNKKTAFERRRADIYKLLDEALNLLYDLPFDKTNEDFKTAKGKLWSAKRQLEHLGTEVGKGYGWSLASEELPKHNSDVLVSLDEEIVTVARYHKDKGFLLDILGDYEVKAWCEIPEWYDWTYEEPELTEAEKKDNYYDMKFHELQEHGEI